MLAPAFWVLHLGRDSKREYTQQTVLSMHMTPIVSPHHDQLDHHHLWLDARSGPDARQRFEASHIRGAAFIDLETDLSTVPKNAVDGGRHPLPSITAWTQTLGRLGITPATRVFIYDDKSGANAAARAWWMLRAVGHTRVSVIDGGLQAAVAADLPTESGSRNPISAAAYPATEYHWPTVDHTAIARHDPAISLLIDVRTASRYAGETEPIDPVAGHIPGAINAPLTEHLHNGVFLGPSELRAHFDRVLGPISSGNTVFSCGSGVTACHGILAMAHAGYSDLPALYVGSWSEWCRRP